jgi:hypothetical protein
MRALTRVVGFDDIHGYGVNRVMVMVVELFHVRVTRSTPFFHQQIDLQKLIVFIGSEVLFCYNKAAIQNPLSS